MPESTNPKYPTYEAYAAAHEDVAPDHHLVVGGGDEGTYDAGARRQVGIIPRGAGAGALSRTVVVGIGPARA